MRHQVIHQTNDVLLRNLPGLLTLCFLDLLSESQEELSHLVLFSVHLKHRDVPLPVDLVTWRMLPHTLGLHAIEINERRAQQRFVCISQVTQSSLILLILFSILHLITCVVAIHLFLLPVQQRNQSGRKDHLTSLTDK